MVEFANKVAIITGGSSGIGAATAKEFARRGASVVLTGRNRERLLEVTRACEAFGAQVLPVLANFENLEEVRSVLDKTIERFKKLDILVNNAGITKRANLENTTLENYDLLFQVNVKAPFYLTQISMPYLVETKGCIVNVSSINAIRHFPNSLAYSMAKAALNQFTKTVALEYASKGVRVNSVNPSYVATNIYKDDNWTAEQSSEFYSRAAHLHPLGKIGTVEELASAISFLASDASNWTTGQCLVLDGGRSLGASQTVGKA